MDYDSWLTNGRWHKCHVCGTRYSDSDGGCNCWECEQCNTIYTEDTEAYTITGERRIQKTDGSWYKVPLIKTVCFRCVGAHLVEDVSEGWICTRYTIGGKPWQCNKPCMITADKGQSERPVVCPYDVKRKPTFEYFELY